MVIHNNHKIFGIVMIKKTPLPSSRGEAILSGESLYNTGKPCKRGHYSPRYTATCNCRQCMFDNVSQTRQKISAIRKEKKEKQRKAPGDQV